MRRWMTRAAVIGASTAIAGFLLPVAAAQAAVPAARYNGFGANTALTASYQAGYIVGAASLTTTQSAGETFAVPAVTCAKKESGIAVASLLFTKKSVTGAGVFVECDKKTAGYFAVLVINGVSTEASFTPAPGDSVTISTSESTTASSASLTDTTQAKTATASGKGNKKLEAAFDGIDSLVNSSTGATLPVPDFGTASITAGSLEGGTVAASGAEAINMETTTVLQITTGALNAGGNAWTETFDAAG